MCSSDLRANRVLLRPSLSPCASSPVSVPLGRPCGHPKWNVLSQTARENCAGAAHSGEDTAPLQIVALHHRLQCVSGPKWSLRVSCGTAPTASRDIALIPAAPGPSRVVCPVLAPISRSGSLYARYAPSQTGYLSAASPPLVTRPHSTACDAAIPTSQHGADSERGS